MNKFLLLSAGIMMWSFSYSQSSGSNAGDFLRESDKLVVVISVLLTIFAGIIFFLIIQDRKISRIEKQIKNKDK